MANEIKKMKQGMSYSCKEKTIILNVFKYFKTQFPEKRVTELVRRTAKATGCSEKSIFQFRKEEASAEGFKEPSKTKVRKNININSRDIKYDNTVRDAIRNVIYDLRYKNIVPSLNKILKSVNETANLPNFSLMTLRRLMFDMGFCYEKNGSKSVLTEKPLTKSIIQKPPNKKINSTPQPVPPINNVNNSVPMNPNPHITPYQQSMIAKPMPQLPLTHNNINMHMSHMNHPVEHQHHRLVTMQLPQHNNHIMPPPMHHQAPPSHNMSMMLNHRRPLPHHVPPQMDSHLRRDNFVLGL